MPTIRIAPAREGLRVRHPVDAQPLPAAGRAVEWDSYWERRLAEGAIRIMPEPVPELPAALKAVKPTKTEE